MKFHYTNSKGWMNDPCGVVFHNGEYHFYYQYNPENPRWEKLNWGHAVSHDLVTWEEKDPVLFPESDYENLNGCLSGCVISKDGKIHAFYTASSTEGDKICEAVSDDGYAFAKNPSNPIIDIREIDSDMRLSSPKVIERDGSFFMLVGAGCQNIGKVLLYVSSDMNKWEYRGEILSGLEYGPLVETPDIFNIEGRDVLMISTVRNIPYKVSFAWGIFTGDKFIFEKEEEPFFAIETGPDFYRPCSFEDTEGKRILIGWMFNWQKNHGKSRIGTMTVPRELCTDYENFLVLQPVSELRKEMKTDSKFVDYAFGIFTVQYEGRILAERRYKEAPDVKVIEDVGTVEVFIDGGRETLTAFVC